MRTATLKVCCYLDPEPGGLQDVHEVHGLLVDGDETLRQQHKGKTQLKKKGVGSLTYLFKTFFSFPSRH